MASCRERVVWPLGAEPLVSTPGTSPDGAWMRRLLRCAQRVGELGHAELVALQQAARLRQDWRFNGCTLMVTLEPCPMCAGALVQARMGRVVFGAADPKRGALGGCLNLASDPSAHHHMQVSGGLLAEACSQQLEDWFRRRRRRAQGLRGGTPATPPPAG
jgi:tRNA(adenine34) deaminase